MVMVIERSIREGGMMRWGELPLQYSTRDAEERKQENRSIKRFPAVCRDTSHQNSRWSGPAAKSEK